MSRDDILTLAQTIYDKLNGRDIAYLVNILEGSKEETIDDLITALDLCEEERDREINNT